MKLYKIIIVTAIVFLFCSCSKDDEQNNTLVNREFKIAIQGQNLLFKDFQVFDTTFETTNEISGKLFVGVIKENDSSNILHKITLAFNNDYQLYEMKLELGRYNQNGVLERLLHYNYPLANPYAPNNLQANVSFTNNTYNGNFSGFLVNGIEAVNVSGEFKLEL
ncbi:hypothetical protein NU10_10650 [Flavobacterium dauae]|uniref:hypothetical protein n=1 Tax=Flavobacterium dauae TaxID=1563479 RepID=UPI00101B48CE|nr:hypothetical protein [Flavobacterium dauae]WLD23163.1 hypothetical protein NU10_10650 [Flavobacterium dauae]